MSVKLTGQEVNFTLFISDLEGDSIYKYFVDDDAFNRFISIASNNQIIITGDIFDSTTGPGMSINDVLSRKSNNIQTLELIVEHANIFLLFGNRDLNKLKCIALCKLERIVDGDNTLINNFNMGLYDKSKIYEMYDTYKRGQFSFVDNLKYWTPFWSMVDGDKKKKVRERLEKPLSDNIFYDRFKSIFGADPSVGTMSAQNLLYTIPNELGYFVKGNDDFNAFVTLLTFNQLLNKNGLLRKVYTDEKNKVCYAFIANIEKLIILSHGGITHTLLTQYERISNSANEFIHKNLDLIKYPFGRSEEEEQKASELGKRPSDTIGEIQNGPVIYGFNKKNGTKCSLTMEDIITNIENINAIYKAHIHEVFETQLFDKKPIHSTLFLLLMTAPSTTMGGIKFESDIYSPIMPGFSMLRTHNFVSDKFDIIQINGHKPNGYLPSVDLIQNDELGTDFSTYNIDLDTSNSFLNTSLNTNVEESIHYLCLDNGSLIIKSNLYIKITDNPPIYINVDDTKYKELPPNEQIELVKKSKIKARTVFDEKDISDYTNPTYSSCYKLLTNTEQSENVDIVLRQPINDGLKNLIRDTHENITVHGCDIYGNIVGVITFLKSPMLFNKILFILNKVNYDKLTKQIQQRREQLGGNNKSLGIYKIKNAETSKIKETTIDILKPKKSKSSKNKKTKSSKTKKTKSSKTKNKK